MADSTNYIDGAVAGNSQDSFMKEIMSDFNKFKEFFFQMATKAGMENSPEATTQAESAQVGPPEPSIRDRIQDGLSGLSFISDATSGHPGTRIRANEKYQTNLAQTKKSRIDDYILKNRAEQQNIANEQQQFGNQATMANAFLGAQPEQATEKPKSKSQVEGFYMNKMFEGMTVDQLREYFAKGGKSDKPKIDVLGKISEDINAETATYNKAKADFEGDPLNQEIITDDKGNPILDDERNYTYKTKKYGGRSVDEKSIVDRNILFGVSQGLKEDSLTTAAQDAGLSPIDKAADDWGRATYPGWDEISDPQKWKIINADYKGR